MSAISLRQNNHLLAELNPGMPTAWFQQLKRVDLKVGTSIGQPRQATEFVYFPVDSIIALVNTMKDGSSVSTAMIGPEGMLGVDVILGNSTRTISAITQASGTAMRLPAAELAKQFEQCPLLRDTMLRFTLSLIHQMEQTSVCNRHHRIDQQLCRWILQSIDRLENNTLSITQELISRFLGVRREGVSEAVCRLQRAGAIACQRGRITVLRRDLLEEISCGCYHATLRSFQVHHGHAA